MQGPSKPANPKAGDSLAEGIRRGKYRKEPLRREKGKETYRVGTVEHGSLIVKEFGPRGLADRWILQHLRPTPGERYGRSARGIADAGALSPPVLFATSEESRSGRRILVGVPEIEGAGTLGRLLERLGGEDRRRLLEKAAQAVRRLHRNGVYHFDLNEDNLLFVEGRNGFVGPYFVDLDYTVTERRGRHFLRRILARLDLTLFVSSRKLELSPEDISAFFTAYGHAPISPSWKPLGGPAWKVRTLFIHLFRGVLLVTRHVE